MVGYAGWNVLYTDRLWWLTGIATVCVSGVVFSSIKKYREKPIFAVFMALLLFGYGYGVVVSANCMLDKSPPEIYRLMVLEKKEENKGFHILKLRLDEPWNTEKDFNPIQYRCYWQNCFERAKKKAYPLLSSDQKRWVSRFFIEFLENEKIFNFTQVVLHRDFVTSNVLVDPKTYEVTGIIDFEETGVYDPAADFIFYDEGENFLTNLVDSYNGANDSNFRNRMKFLYCHAGLTYILTVLRNLAVWLLVIWFRFGCYENLGWKIKAELFLVEAQSTRRDI